MSEWQTVYFFIDISDVKRKPSGSAVFEKLNQSFLNHPECDFIPGYLGFCKQTDLQTFATRSEVVVHQTGTKHQIDLVYVANVV